MNVFTTIIAPICIGIITLLMSVVVSNRTGAGDTFGIVMGVASGIVVAGVLIHWSARFRN